MIQPWRAHFGEKMMRTYITNGERTIYTSKDDADFLVEALNRSAKVEGIAIPPSRFYGGTIQDEIARAQIHGPNALTLEALETTLARAEAAERDFMQVHKNCIEARSRAEKAEQALSETGDSAAEKRDASRWRFLEHGCQWVGFTPTGGETRSFDPRIVSGYAGHLQDMRATVDAEIAKQIALLEEGAEKLKRSLK